MSITEQLKKKLKSERKTIKWFWQNYLPEYTYSALSSQINGFNGLDEDVRNAIEKYIRGE